jgi:ferredoxin
LKRKIAASLSKLKQSKGQSLFLLRKNSKNFIKEKEMKAVVDQDLCIGCGICEGIAPEVFSLAAEPYAEVLQDPIAEENQEAAKEAAEECPEAAIAIEE